MDESDPGPPGFSESSPEQEDLRRLTRYLISLGATDQELADAQRHQSLAALGLDLVLRPPGGLLNLGDAAAAAGLEVAEAARLWRALGFPDPEASAPRLAPDSVEALRVIETLGRVLGPQTVLALARVIGASASRLAEALVDAFRVQLEMPELAAGVAYSEIVERFAALARDGLPQFLDALGAVFRRHLVAFASGAWSLDEGGSTTRRDVAVGFADLVGYTAFSHALSGRQLADAVTHFEDLVGEVVAHHGGRLVKLIGDGAMFVNDDTLAACELALELAERLHQDLLVPPVRGAVAAGSVVTMQGDYFGDVINLAARLVAVAEPSTVVAAESVRERVGDRFVFDPMPPRLLRGFPLPERAYRLGRLGQEA